MSTNDARCGLCGEVMPAGEEMFKFHGYSGPCPKPRLVERVEIRKVAIVVKVETNRGDRIAELVLGEDEDYTELLQRANLELEHATYDALHR